jgi:predicted enzyme involved in methoxymalonyl-ACP biosynthesis
MSCRVLGRRVEDAVLQELLLQARRRGVDRIVGIYHPTERNKLVEDHYAKLGFALVERQPDGTTVWQLSVAEAPIAALPLEVRRLDCELVGA